MCSEHGIGDVFVVCIIWPCTLVEEIFASHVTESRKPVARIGCIWTIIGHEVRIKQVVDAPNESVVDEGIGNFGRAEKTYSTGIFTIVGATHPCFAEASAAIVEFTCQTVD